MGELYDRGGLKPEKTGTTDNKWRRYWFDIVATFPNYRDYMGGQPLRQLADLAAATANVGTGNCTAARVLAEAVEHNWSLGYYAERLSAALGQHKVWLTERVYHDLFLQDQPAGDGAESHHSAVRPLTRSEVPDVVMSKEIGDGSWWFNYEWFVEPALESLRQQAYRAKCEPWLLGTAEERAQLDDEDLFVIHQRNFREEHLFNLSSELPYARVRELLLTKATLRPAYLARLAQAYHAKRVLVVSGPEYQHHTDELAELRRTGHFDSFETRSSSFLGDFCFLMRMRGTLVLNTGSTFSYWAAVLNERVSHVVAPRVLGVHANAEKQGRKPHRNLWPVDDPKWTYVDVWHGGIDSRYPNGTELVWRDGFYTNGTKRAIPITWPAEGDAMPPIEILPNPNPNWK